MYLMAGNSHSQHATAYIADRRVGRVIAGYLAAFGHTQTELAEFIPLNKSQLSRSMAGRRRWNLDELERAAEFLDLPIGVLVDPDGFDPSHLAAARERIRAGVTEGYPLDACVTALAAA